MTTKQSKTTQFYQTDITTQAAEPQFWGLDSYDLHCWVEVNGKILDYPVRELEKSSLYGTKKLKYAPFHEELQPLLEEKWRKSYEDKSTQLKGQGIDYQLIWVTTAGYCWYRSIIIYDKLKAKGLNPKIVYGSLGFVQKDNSVFYEFG